MAMAPFAFSIHNFISSVGADAGFAAAIGLAVLILLYFAHARETANLREQAALLTQRLQQAEARVAQLARVQPAAQVAAPVAARAPFAPAGTAAPALASATRVIPVALPAPEPAFVAAAPGPVVARQPAVAPAPAMAMAGVATAPPASGPPAVTPSGPVMPPPVVSPPPAPIPASAPVAMPAPATNAGGNGAGHKPGGASPVDSTSLPGASRELPPLLEIPPRKRRRRGLGRGVAVALTSLVAVAVAVGLFAVTSLGGSTKHSPAAPASNAPSASRGHAVGTFKPSSVTVAVLNGTAINQLAHRVAAKLAALGYKNGTIATASNQTETTTVVAYLRGTGDRNDALRIAGALGLRRSSVQPVDQSTLQVACAAPSACTANVVVTVGTDLAGQ